MVAVNDYKCANKECGSIERDMIYAPDRCLDCGGIMEVTFENWHTIEFDARKDERTDAKGFVKSFSALDDPLCQAQLGIGDAKLQSYNQMTPDEQKVLQERLIADGDSPKFRREILNKYNAKLGNKYDLQD